MFLYQILASLFYTLSIPGDPILIFWKGGVTRIFLRCVKQKSTAKHD